MYTAIVNGRNIGHYMTEQQARVAALKVNPNATIRIERV